MARTPGRRTIPWARTLEIGLLVARQLQARWGRLSENEQRTLTRLVRKSRGRPGNISAGERAELRRLASKALGLGR